MYRFINNSNKLRNSMNFINWSPKEGVFPASTVIKKSASKGVFFILCGFFLIIGLKISIWDTASRFGWLRFLGVLPFLMVCIIFIANGLNFIFYLKRITLRINEIECDEINYFIRIHWKEPIGHYIAIIKQIIFSRNIFGSPIFKYRIFLKHESKSSKDIVLYESNRWNEVNYFWQMYSEKFKLKPSVVIGDKTLDFQKLIKNKDILLLEPESMKFSNAKFVENAKGVYEIKIPLKSLGASFIKFLIFTGFSVLVYVQNSYLLLSIGGFFSFFYCLLTINDYFSFETLFLEKDGFSYFRKGPLWKKTHISIASELITQIRIEKSIIIESPYFKLYLGRYLSSEEKRKLSDFMIALFCQNPLYLKGAA